jgi:small subunit ribosomal protein S15
MALNKEQVEKIVQTFGANAKDTGSSVVQVALLTESIKELTDHCKKHPKDVSTNLGLMKKVCQRRRHLKYLEKNDFESYKNVIGRLGLKK